MFQYYFEEKTKSEVIEILEKYQNEDGGFGTLDYDFIFTMSCLKQSESACCSEKAEKDKYVTVHIMDLLSGHLYNIIILDKEQIMHD